MPAIAAARYWGQREKYRSALDMIDPITDENIRVFLRKALTAHVRGQLRAISKGLTIRMGCRFTCIPTGYTGPVEVEHAIPLKLIHNRILGIKKNGVVDNETQKIFATTENIEAYVRAFVIGVLVTPAQHTLLNAQDMHGEWTWLADIQPWDWSDLKRGVWNYNERPLWLRSIMNRYEHVPLPEGPIKYRLIEEQERKCIQERSRYWSAV